MPNKKEDTLSRDVVISTLLERVDLIKPDSKTPCRKHKTMASNPFRFFRGSAQIFYHDIAEGVLKLPKQLSSLLPHVMVMGDCHVSNFGFFTEEGSHDETVIFGPNDFDDACVGSCLWDLVRFCTSLSLSAEYCRGIEVGKYTSEETIESPLTAASESETKAAIRQFLYSYVDTCEDLHRDQLKHHHVIKRFAKDSVLYPFWKKAKKRAVGGKHFSTKSALAKAIDNIDEKPAFKTLPKKFVRLSDDFYAEVEQQLSPYVDDHILDIVQRIGSGTGSVNMKRYYLLVGPKNVNASDPDELALCHVVEVKKQREAAPLSYFKNNSPINRLTPAHLTVVCKRRMQRRPDLILDDVEWDNQHFLVRSRHHAKVGIKPEDIGFRQSKNAIGLVQYAAVCGEALALAHSRADRRSTRFEKVVASQLPNYLEELVSNSIKYAEQVKRDWEIMVTLVNSNSSNGGQ
jgi:uncharacterized protein (DUF2252 family)